MGKKGKQGLQDVAAHPCSEQHDSQYQEVEAVQMSIHA